MNEENRIKAREIRQLKKSGYLDKITPLIPKNEEILAIHLHIEVFNRIMGYFLITIIIMSIIYIYGIYDFSIWTFVRIVIGIIIYIYYIFAFKRGYSIKILVFTNKGMYLFDNVSDGKSVKYSDMKFINFYGFPIHAHKKKFYVNLGLNFKIKSNIDSLKFMYFLLYYYCNPKIQIKNRLKNQNVQNAEEGSQKIIKKSLFKISNERYTDIYKKKESLIIKYVSYELLTFIIIILLLLFVHYQMDFMEEWYLIIMIDAFILLIGILILIILPITVRDFKKSYKKINYLPDSNFEVCSDGIKAISNSGDVWIPFEENLIIGSYDCIEKGFTSLFTPDINDGIEIKKFNRKNRLYQIGPVEDYEYFYDIVMYHYLKWLDQNDLILKEEQIKELFFLSDPFKGAIAEKIMLKEEDTDVPNISDMSSFYIDSEKAIFKYPKVSYNRYIPDDEKIYFVHQQETYPPFIRRKLLLSLVFTVIFGILLLLSFVYLQNEYPDDPEMYSLLIFPLIPFLLMGVYLLQKVNLFKDIKKLEVLFTESKIIFKRKGWLYPLLYDDIRFVYKTSENRKKRYYKYLKFHAIKKSNVITLYGIGFDSPILTILNSKCKVLKF